ncbi:stage II sporulation protein D [Brevibacillus fulvus]|uniref:Stage II sporulation protein D n=1 Tax=Brevibacillus fulvus TaxID=1125967 RepID=A0A939BS69_9BACL|nr:stage II sporulation protein D [Brevibacillus fulvus]MBM7590163.1 stage II sporulation protein D [Brevibacillus fulvus]
MRRYLLFLFIALPLLVVAVPATLVYYFSPATPPVQPAGKSLASPASLPNQIPVKVYRSEKKVVETVPLESYVEGVVAAEMPADFELEALKAQAMAARTYIIRRINANDFSDVPDGGQVLDTVKHQVYLDEEQRKQNWGDQFEWKNARIRQAVLETAGMILTYQGDPIDATFFSTSNGFTEDASEYWQQPIPYLRSVASPWDVNSPRYEESKPISVAEVEQKLGVKLDLAAARQGGWYQVIQRTAGNRIGKIQIGNKEFTGRQIREKLGLNSSAFTMELRGNTIVFHTRGYGHGVGMSQWGANGMAKAGKKAEEIVKYFYQGIALQNYQQAVKG